MSVLRLSIFVLALLLLASLSALAAPGKNAANGLDSNDFHAQTGQGRMRGGIVANEVAGQARRDRVVLTEAGKATVTVPHSGEHIPEMGQ